ncbi:MAG: TIGR00304 family membrane protein [Candidatus Thorarchaeota archaeon]|jgi:uncharacterized protein (TIGR00304 family)
MIAQVIPWLEMIAFGIIGAGIILVILGIWLMSRSTGRTSSEVKRESKGIVFIGPIPLVWGYSRRTQGILFIIAMIILIAWLVWWNGFN